MKGRRMRNSQSAPNIASIAPKEKVLIHRASDLYTETLVKARRTSRDSLSCAFSQNWVISFVSVNFDLEIGPTIDCIYPDTDLSKQEKDTISFSSFPDSNSFLIGDCTFIFRYRKPKPNNKRCFIPAEFGEIGDYIYGYVFFRQTRDLTIRRGFLQVRPLQRRRIEIVSFIISVSLSFSKFTSYQNIKSSFF
ncbi:FAM116 domain-containing protein [Rozella allomycis CSF55]|uniref:FAM116 domain-containing protein n=1 Tax=Rozella allomycis (strain CSF55) TaxID=988480 RepID=A0A075AU15_ROZAC|nr:FAM116 domain-containing protein [Rozella allomycis CSF55]|eukprot:EPZ33620.1 FAM116 domain-containing protein [Rozella allomycis CSF55]